MVGITILIEADERDAYRIAKARVGLVEEAGRLMYEDYAVGRVWVGTADAYVVSADCVTGPGRSVIELAEQLVAALEEQDDSAPSLASVAASRSTASVAAPAAITIDDLPGYFGAERYFFVGATRYRVVAVSDKRFDVYTFAADHDGKERPAELSIAGSDLLLYLNERSAARETEQRREITASDLPSSFGSTATFHARHGEIVEVERINNENGSGLFSVLINGEDGDVHSVSRLVDKLNALGATRVGA